MKEDKKLRYQLFSDFMDYVEKNKTGNAVTMEVLKKDRELYYDTAMYLILIDKNNELTINDRNILNNKGINSIIDWLDYTSNYRTKDGHKDFPNYSDLFASPLYFNTINKILAHTLHIKVSSVIELATKSNTKNIDGTYMYWSHDMDDVDIHVATNTLLKLYGEGKMLDTIIDYEVASIRDIDVFIAFWKDYSINGLPENYNTLQEAFIYNIRNVVKNEVMSDDMILSRTLFKFIQKVPADIMLSRPEGFKNEYKKIKNENDE